MSVRFLDLARQTEALRLELDHAISRVLDGGIYVGGEEVEAFEHEFAMFCGAGYAVGVNSGTDALELALRGLGIGAGDEVITAANTCVPTVAAIVATGATPVLVDADPLTMTLDPERLRGRVRAPCRARSCPSISTAASPRWTRSWRSPATAGCSWSRTSPRPTARGGTGAGPARSAMQPPSASTRRRTSAPSATPARWSRAIATLAERVRCLRAYGAGNGATGPGRNSRLDPLQAAVLRAKLPFLDVWNARRRELAGRYDEGLAGLPVRLPAPAEDGEHVWHLYVVSAVQRESLRANLAQCGVSTLVHYDRPVHGNVAFESLARPGRLPVSERLCAEVLSLPLYPELRDEEAEFVIDAVHASFSRLRVAR